MGAELFINSKRRYSPQIQCVGFGGGAGVEYFFKDFLPQLGWNLEIGFGSVNFKEAPYDFNAMMVGWGAHYYF